MKYKDHQGKNDELYDELVLHSLSKKRWRNKLFISYAILNGLLPKHIYSHLAFPSPENYLLRSALTSKINFIPSRIKCFKKPFYPIA